MNGWINLYKPSGVTSQRCLNQIKHMIPKTKIGHAGTLDPLACGVLPVALGEATKALPYILDTTKEYIFDVTWGQERATDDSQGDVLLSSDNRPSPEDILKILPQFMGTISQVPPLYSANKIQGQRACNLMRKGREDIVLQAKTLDVYALNLKETLSPDFTRFFVQCAQGTYVRSLARDMGRLLGCYGYASMIERVRSGPFTKDQTISLEKLAEYGKMSIVQESILPLQAVLDDIPAVLVSFDEAVRLKSGQSLVIGPDRLQGATSLQVLVFYEEMPVAMAVVEGAEIKPQRVFNLNFERKN